MNRRRFLRAGAAGAVCAPFIAQQKIVDAMRGPVDPLPPMKQGQLLTAKDLNDIVERVNTLSEALR